jgi:alkanesulfonate monooxygenase SsuD/methylene tetrahydromethanopterin reductase-like flavin-dependent oxidoreductase (luciferase family)
VRFGAIVIPYEPWEAVVEHWRTLDELGLETIWGPDHLWYPRGPQFLEGWTTLAALAGVARRARIGTLVTSIVFRSPALVAKQALAVDHVSGGRLELGIGAGSESDHEPAGVERWTSAERSERLRAFVHEVDRLLRSNELGRPLQQPRPPLTVAASGERNLRLAAEVADRWNTTGRRGLSPDEGLELVRRLNGRLDRLCDEAGRDPRSVLRSFLAAHGWISDTPLASESAFRAFVERYREAGVEEIVLYYPPERFYPDGTVERGLFGRLAERVLPELRG